MGAHERFEQGIARQAIGAVQPGAGHLADRIEAANVGLAINVRQHAAALVMGGGHHRDRLLGDVNAIAEAGLVDVWEAINDEPGRLVGDVEQDIIGPALLHLAVNGAGDDVARRQRLERVEPSP